MSKLMGVLVNGVAELEYDRSHPLDENQQRSLAAMDEKMDKGIELDGRFVRSPDLQQRARFVAGQLLDTLRQDRDALAAAMTAWLATRLPDLKQVRIDERDGRVVIDLVFDKDYGKQALVDFRLH